MEQIEKVIAIGLLGTLCSLVLKKDAPVFSFFTGIVTGILILTVVFSSLKNVVSLLEGVFLKTNVDTQLATTVFKICAIGILGEYFCNLTEDCGEKAIAKKMELASKIIIFTYILPIVAKIMENVWDVF